MQVFMTVVKVTINTLEGVSPETVKEAIQEELDEFGGGTAEVISVVEEG